MLTYLIMYSSPKDFWYFWEPTSQLKIFSFWELLSYNFDLFFSSLGKLRQWNVPLSNLYEIAEQLDLLSFIIFWECILEYASYFWKYHMVPALFLISNILRWFLSLNIDFSTRCWIPSGSFIILLLSFAKFWKNGTFISSGTNWSLEIMNFLSYHLAGYMTKSWYMFFSFSISFFLSFILLFVLCFSAFFSAFVQIFIFSFSNFSESSFFFRQFFFISCHFVFWNETKWNPRDRELT